MRLFFFIALLTLINGIAALEIPAGLLERAGLSGYKIEAGEISRKPFADILTKEFPGQSLKGDGYFVVVKGKTVTIGALNQRGLHYGLYDLLQRGCQWTPARPADIRFTEKFAAKDMAFLENPAFEIRGLMGMGYNGYCEDFGDWLLFNRLNNYSYGIRTYYTDWAARIRSKGFLSLISGHSLYYWLPGELYDSHPEYFPLVDGKRLKYTKPNYSVGVQLDFGSAEARAEVVGNIKKFLRDNPDTYSIPLVINDGGGFGDTPAERAMDDPDEYKRYSFSTRYMKWVNLVADEVCKEFPGVKIVVLPYLYVTDAPQVDRIHPNVMIGFCTYRRCYKHEFNDSSCHSNAAMNKTLKEWLRFGNPAFIRDYMLLGGLPEFPVPMLKVLQKDFHYFRSLGVTGYVSECVAEASNMKDRGFYKWARQIPNYWTGMKMNYYLIAKLMWNPGLDLDKEIDGYFHDYFGDAGAPLKKINELIEKRWFADPSSYIWNKYDTNFPAMLFTESADIATIEKLLAEAEKCAAAQDQSVFRDRVKTECVLVRDNWFKKAAVVTKDMTAAPLPGKVTMETVMKNGAAIDGFVKRADKGVAPSELNTKIYAGYTADRLYLLAECTADMDKITAKPVERDGLVWNNDTIEIFIEPLNEQRKWGFFHIITDPLGSVYDAALRDRSWNADITTHAERRGDRWLVMVGIPFDALGISQGKAGAVFKLNIGRSSKNPREISSWTDGTFENPATFGRLLLK